MTALQKLIDTGARELGLELPAGALAAFETYARFLAEKSAVMNLTAVRGDEDTARLHFLDSLALLRFADIRGKSVIDIGTGAGFPGVPLAIAEPGAAVTLLDSLDKRVGFLRELCEKIGVSARCVHARAEEQAREPGWRDGFDLAASRAVARMNVLCELCMPFVREGGAFIAMKAAACDEELDEAKSAIETLGGELESVAEYTIPGADVVRRAVIVRKTAPTPEKYPRRFAKIQKSPL